VHNRLTVPFWLTQLELEKYPNSVVEGHREKALYEAFIKQANKLYEYISYFYNVNPINIASVSEFNNVE